MNTENPFAKDGPLENSGTKKYSPESESKRFREEILFPHVEAILSVLDSHKEKIFSIDRESVRDILWSFIEQRVNNSEIYHSEKHGADFPWTKTDTGELAKILYRQARPDESNLDKLKPSSEIARNEFVFTTLIDTSGGNQFTFQEEALHQAIKDLPAALESLKRGEEPAKNEIFSLGSPTNELGKISPEFAEKMKGKAFDVVGELYAEFISEQLPRQIADQSRRSVSFYGISMGASFAVSTAKHLIESGDITQSKDEAGGSKPFATIRIDTAPGTSDVSKSLKKWQIPIGFAVETAVASVTDPYLREVIRRDKGFLESTKKFLKKTKGIEVNMTEEQERMKKAAVRELIENLRNGTPIPEGVKVTEVVGDHDLLMYQPGFSDRLQEQEEEHEGSLGEKIVKGEDKNRRVFGAHMGHAIPFLRESEIRRLTVAADSLRSIKK